MQSSQFVLAASISLLLLACAAPACPDGFHESDGVCLENSDTGGDSSNPADTGTDTDTSGDPYIGVCAPPDGWTADIASTSYSTSPFSPTYDAQIEAVTARMSADGGGGSFGEPMLIAGATVMAVDSDHGALWVGDGRQTLAFHAWDAADAGDIVSFTVASWNGVDGTMYGENPGSWTKSSGGNPVPAVEVGNSPLDYEAHLSQRMHMYGEVTKTSSFDCGAGNTCFVVDSEGTSNLIRISTGRSTAGLDVDYAGGLCAEIIAPVGVYNGADGGATYLDVARDEWIRTWSKP